MDKEAVKKAAWRVHDFIAVGILILMVAIAGQRMMTQADDLMVVDKVYIPDHAEHYDPEVLYGRTVLKDFTAAWEVRIYDVSDQTVVCSGGDTNDYTTTSDVSGVTLSWYVGKHCDLPPGRYMARTEWNPIVGEKITNSSNVFNVFPEGSRSARQAMRSANDN